VHWLTLLAIPVFRRIPYLPYFFVPSYLFAPHHLTLAFATIAVQLGWAVLLVCLALLQARRAVTTAVGAGSESERNGPVLAFADPGAGDGSNDHRQQRVVDRAAWRLAVLALAGAVLVLPLGDVVRFTLGPWQHLPTRWFTHVLWPPLLWTALGLVLVALIGRRPGGWILSLLWGLILTYWGAVGLLVPPLAQFKWGADYRIAMPPAAADWLSYSLPLRGADLLALTFGSLLLYAAKRQARAWRAGTRPTGASIAEGRLRRVLLLGWVALVIAFVIGGGDLRELFVATAVLAVVWMDDRAPQAVVWATALGGSFLGAQAAAGLAEAIAQPVRFEFRGLAVIYVVQLAWAVVLLVAAHRALKCQHAYLTGKAGGEAAKPVRST